ncbi:hypothetical protein [Streptomyces sp. NPDC054940]
MDADPDLAAPRVDTVVRRDAALLEDDLRAFLAALTAGSTGTTALYAAALHRSLHAPVADALGSKVGRPALHVTHGVSVALNTGSWLIMAALRHTADPAVVDSLLRSVGDGFTGQALDLATRSPDVRAGLPAAPYEERVRFWESVAARKTGTLFRMPLDSAAPPPDPAGLTGARLKSYVLDHPKLTDTLLGLSAQAVEWKRSGKEAVHAVCRSPHSAAHFDVTIDRKGHLIDRLHETLRRR